MSDPKPIHFRLFLFGGLALSFCAGTVNAQTLLSTFSMPATHVTGTVSQLGMAAGIHNTANAGLVLSVLLAFAIGAALSGAVIDSTQVTMGQRYGIILIVASAMLTGGAVLLTAGRAIALPLVACASGLQNGMGTRVSSAVVRTTHMTGILTDLGIALGKFVAGRHVTVWRVQLYATFLSGFLGGCAVGGWMYEHLGPQGLFVSAAILALLGCGYLVWRRRHLPTPVPAFE